MKTSPKRRRRRRLLIGDTLLGIVAVVVMSLAFTAQATPPPVTASFLSSTGGISLNNAGTIAEAVNTPDDSKFVQLDAAATITKAGLTPPARR